MDDSNENQALLFDEFNVSRNDNDRIRNSRSNSAESHQSDDWWEGSGSSCSSSYCCDSHSDHDSVADWEAHVTARGELFYIQSYPRCDKTGTQLDNEASTTATVETKKKSALTNSAKDVVTGKLVRLIRRRNSRRSVRKKASESNAEKGHSQQAETRPPTSSKVTFCDSQEGEEREVLAWVNPGESHNLGRRATLSETLLGLITSTFADNTRVMVAGFIPNGEAIKHRNIKIGDWLRSVNGEDVTPTTIDLLLRKIDSPTQVRLMVQRVAGWDVTKQISTGSTEMSGVEQSEGAKRVVSGLRGQVVTTDAALAVLYLATEGLTEDGHPDQGILYAYPKQNSLAAARGAFITLHHLLPTIVPSPPYSSSVLLNGQLSHIIYTAEESELLLLAVPDSMYMLKEAVMLNNDLVCYLKFSYQSLSRCFSEPSHHSALDQFFSLFMSTAASPATQQWQSSHFEDLLPAAHWIPLPRDTQMQIDDALNELEANDFGDYSDDNHGCQRLYSILGTCLFHKNYLLGYHLSRQDVVDMNCFCRQTGLLQLLSAEPVRSLVVWREVFPASCDRGLGRPATPAPYTLPLARWFLLIVGQGHEMLGVLLESGGCTVRVVGNPEPDVIYVEQAQATLAHINKLGIQAIASKWIELSPRPQVAMIDSPPKSPPKRLTDCTPTVSRTTERKNTSSPNTGSSKKTPEVMSILKHRASPDSTSLSLIGSGVGEDSGSGSQAASSVVSDEAAPILGRRAERERANNASDSNSQSHLSESDLSDEDSEFTAYTERKTRYGSRSFDVSDLGKTLLNDVDYIIPSRLTAGVDNVLFHYVHLDCTEGVLLSPPDGARPQRLQHIVQTFRTTAQAIHALLHNTVRFKKLKAQEISASLINKSLIAIKEHGFLFECPPAEEEMSKKTNTPLCYWVVGRLFFMPYPREVYVCYQDTAPQNMVEIAFRLALSASG